MKLITVLALLACPFAAAAAGKPPQFAHAAPLALEAKGAIYALTLPAEVYRGLARRDLGDLRVLNGAGEEVPHALERLAATERTAGATLALAYFPVFAPAGGQSEAVSMSVERRADGTLRAAIVSGDRRAAARGVVGYVIDASAASAALRQLRFDWPVGSEGGTLDVRIEASDDLRSWRPAGSGPLLVLRRGETVLERRTVDFAPVRAKYFRMSWRAGQGDPKLTGVTAQTVDASTDAQRAWLRFDGASGAKPGEYVFELPPSLPVDRLRFELPQQNTVVSAVLTTQDRPAGPERHVASAVLYRMEHGGEKLESPDLQIAATAEKRWLLRVDARGGGLGGGMPALNAGWLPHRLIFIARGDGPFQLVFGNADAASSAMAVTALVPGHASDKPVAALGAKLGAVATREIPALTPVVAARDYVDQMDRKKLWLWGSLLLAVLVIVGMAWRLTREMPAPGEPPKSRPPGEVR